MFAGAPQWSTEDDGGSAVVHTTRQCDEALSLNQWITSNRVGIESHQLETAEWRNYLERSVLVLRSLVEKMAGGGSGVDEILWMHPNYITAENITVRDQTSMGGEVAADFMERGNSVFFGVGEDDMREKRVAMDALGRVAYDMVMLLGGPSLSELRRHELNSQHGGDAVGAKTDEEEVIDILRKLPRMTTSEEKGDGSGVIAAMLEANVPFPLCRFVSDLLGDGRDETIGRSNYSFTSFADVLSDLRQMVDNPDAFLHPSSTHRWKLAFGEKLFGREAETKVFFDAADRVATAHDDPVLAELSSLIGGSKEVIMLSGHSGAGKSRLVQLAGTALEKKGWRFLRCKFDRVAHSEPLSVLASAFDDYFTSLFVGCPKHGIDGLFSLSTEAECRCTGLNEIRHRLRKICAEGLGILAKHIPSLRELDLIDSTLPTTTVEVTETETRLQFGKLLQALSSRRSPILLFVDDLQWADPLSLAMLYALVKGSRPDLLHLVYTDDDDNMRAGPEDETDVNVLFAGSYRDKEVDNDHQLAQILAKFQSDSSIKLTNISISGFTHQTLNQMLSETLYMPVRRVGSLSTLVIQKTDGHPLHVIEFIRALVADKLLTHSFSRGWEWDADSIDSFPITDSVAELFSFKLRRLPKDILRGLQILSCFGSQIDQHVLKFVAGYDGDESADLSLAIHVALSEGLLEQAAQIIRFAHDTIQKATTDSIGKEGLVPLLGKLSSALIVNATAAGELDSVLFVVIDLIDVIGSSATLSPQDRAHFANLNLRAGTKAISVPDFASAARYAENGICFLGENCWQEQYRLSLGLHEIAVRFHFSSLGGDRNLLMKRINAIFDHVVDFSDKFKTLCVWIEMLSTTGLTKAIQECLKALEMLGEPLNLVNVGYREVCDELRKCKEEFSAGSLPERRLTDVNKVGAMKMLALVYVYYHRQKSFLIGFVACQMVKITMKYGYCEDSAFGASVFAASLVSILDDIDEGSAWGRAVLSLMEMQDDNAFQANVNTALYGVIFHWKEPLQSTLEQLAEGIKLSLSTGNIEWAIISTGYYTVRSFNCGKNIRVLSREVAALERQFSPDSPNTSLLQLLSGDSPMYGPLLQFLLAPLHITLRHLEGEGSFSNDEEISFPLDKVRVVSNDGIMELALDMKQYSCFFNLLIYQTTEALLFRDMNSALRYTNMYVQHFLSDTQRFKFSEMYSIYYEALITLHFMRQTGDERYRQRAETALRIMKEWSRHSEWNFSSKLHLMEAEWHNSLKQYDQAALCYERSIKAAHDHKFVHEEGICNELAGIFCWERGLIAKSHELFLRSIECYKKWGAHAVARRVEDDMRNKYVAGSVDVRSVVTPSVPASPSMDACMVDSSPSPSVLSEESAPSKKCPAEEEPSSKKRQLDQRSDEPDELSPSIATLGSAILAPGQNGVIADEQFLEEKTFILAGSFVEVNTNRIAAGTAVAKMLESFGGKVVTRFSKSTSYLLAGKYAGALKINSAQKRDPPVEIINLNRLQRLLVGELTFESMSALPRLSKVNFKDDTYEPARVIPTGRVR